VATELRKTGIESVGDVPWGTHFCHFYETKEDLLEILIPYFKTGLENNEYCIWVTFDPLSEEEAKEALRRAIPEAERYLASGGLEIIPHSRWYLKDGIFDLQRVINDWKEKLDQALVRGYAGMRVNGNEAWLTEKDWKNFSEYEEKLNRLIGNQQMIVLCTYPLAMTRAGVLFDVARTHQFAVVKRNGNWEVLETPALKQAKTEIMKLNEELEQRVIERTGELAVSNKELGEKSKNLEDVNTALRVLLKQREEDEKDFGESIMSNVRTLITPYIEKLKESRLSSTQTTLMEILESNVSEVTSAFTRKLGLQHANLTPTEIRIAALNGTADRRQI
jgi:hypothetical protein